MLGFEGLADSMPVGKEDEFPTIVLARLLGRKNIIDQANIVDDDDVERTVKARLDEARKNAYSQMMNFDEEEGLDLDD